MSEANSIASMVTYSLKSLFNPGQEAVHPSRQDIGDSDPFAKTLADASPATREVPPTITADSEDGLPVPLPEGFGSAKDNLPPSESRLPAETGSMTQSTGKIIPHHPILTWQLVSSATDIEQNEDMMQTAALPLKGYRIYSEAASQRD